MLAHVAWFEEDRPARPGTSSARATTLALLAAALLVTIAVRLIARVWPGVDIPWLARMAPWMPFALRMHLAVSLVSLLSLGFYLSPAMDLHFNFAGRAARRDDGASSRSRWRPAGTRARAPGC